MNNQYLEPSREKGTILYGLTKNGTILKYEVGEEQRIGTSTGYRLPLKGLNPNSPDAFDTINDVWLTKDGLIAESERRIAELQENLEIFKKNENKYEKIED